MLKLYGGARSRASIVKWYLEELAIPYEFVLLDMQAGEHRQPEFLAINPMGKVPAIADGDFYLWESGAKERLKSVCSTVTRFSVCLTSVEISCNFDC